MRREDLAAEEFTSLPERKQLLRVELLARRRAITDEERIEMDRLILGSLLSLPEFAACSVLLCYVSAKGEPDTLLLLRSALAQGKTVAVPRCGPGGRLDFYRIRNLDELKSGTFGIPEPKPSDRTLMKSFPADSLCVVPALSFDRSGSRLGYGKGYYDRFLDRFGGRTAGVCYSVLLGDTPLPAEQHDRPVSLVVTDRGVVRTTGR
jgi:5-formyltetrahydrofolate cyclo-ligase